ncbi:MAG TPA: hypothetical protein VF707_18960 [Ardenticatenaceae bacterium]|jgi:hypothetical protein
MYIVDFSSETGRWYVVNLRTGMRYGLMEGYGTREEAEATAAMFDDGFEPMLDEVEEPVTSGTA